MTSPGKVNPKKYASREQIARELGLRSLPVEIQSATLRGWMENPSGTQDAVLDLVEAKDSRPSYVAMLPNRDLVEIATQILLELEPSALDAGTLLHETVRRIDRNVSRLCERMSIDETCGD